MLTKTEARRMLKSMETLGNILIAWRTLAGLNQSDAARRCNLSPQYWWLLENDKRPNPGIDTLEKLADGTGIDIDRLVIAAAYSRKAAMERSRNALMPATA